MGGGEGGGEGVGEGGGEGGGESSGRDGVPWHPQDQVTRAAPAFSLPEGDSRFSRVL